MTGRWICHNYAWRFDTPNYSIVAASVPVTGRISDEDPSLPHGQVVKFYCPKCGSDKLGGAANSNPFTPKQVKPK